MHADLAILLVSSDPAGVTWPSGADCPARLRATTVSCVARAKESLQVAPADAIVVDLDAAAGDALDLVDALREAAPRAPIICLADRPDADRAAGLLRRGAQDCLSKHSWASERGCQALCYAIERHRALMATSDRGQAHAEQAAQIASIVEVTADAIVVIGPDGLPRFANPAAEAMFGRPRDVLLAMPFGFPVAAPSRQGNGATELDYRRADGTPGIASMKLSPILWNGEASTLASLRDVTKRVHTEAALKDALERLRAVLTNAPMLLWAMDATGRVTVSEGRLLDTVCQRLGGSEPAAALERLAAMPAMTAPTAQALRGEWVHEQIDLQGLILKIWFTPLVNDGRVTGTIGVAIDVTDHVILEMQLRQSQKMEAIGRLAGGIAHDFNNLLTVIGGAATFAAEELDTHPQTRDHLARIQDAVQSAARMTGQLLAFSRKQVVQLKVLDLGQEVARLENILRRLIGEDVQLTTRMLSEHVQVKADPGQLEQVVLNLVVNARDAMPIGGHLTIETSLVQLDAESAASMELRPGRYASLSVRDTGVGMDEATLRSIFEPFFTTKESGRGTGLGLATVYGIVLQHGGSIRVASNPGQGATFRVLLPAVTSPQPSDASRTPDRSAMRGTETILVVEDQPEVLHIIQRILGSYGYNVLAAKSPDQALKICRERSQEVDLLLSDLVLPTMSGKELAEVITRERPQLRVVYMSGYTDDAVARHGVLNTGVAFLQKPFAPMTLVQTVRESLDDVSSTVPDDRRRTMRRHSRDAMFPTRYQATEPHSFSD